MNDQQRWFLLTVPEAHADEPMPLVVSFHGLMEGAEIHNSQSAYGELGMSEGFITAAPHGSGEPVRWDLEAEGDTHDLDFVDAMLADIGERLCVDRSRVYASGLSYGAMKTSFLLCERSEVFAAAAPVAGITAAAEDCDQQRPVPIVTFHGTDDDILLFNGGVGAIPGMGADEAPVTTEPTDLEGDGYPATVAEWADKYGCDPDHTDTPVGDEVIHRVYDCPEGAEVEFYIVEGGGHSWPGSDFSAELGDVVGHTTFDVDASVVAWEFFQRFSLGD